MELLQHQTTLMKEIFLIIAHIVHSNGYLTDDMRVCDISKINDSRHKLTISKKVDFVDVILNNL